MANGTWKIARGKGSAQLPLAIVVVLAVTLLLAGKAHFLPFDRARATITDWAKPALQVVNMPAAAASGWLSGVWHFFDVYSENLRLRKENARLRQWQGAAMMLEARVKRYKLLLNAVSDPSAKSTTAKVIGRSSRPFSQTMILDAGRLDGVKPGQTVADASGMLGRIYLDGEHTSWVILVTDLNSRIPVLIQPSNDQAILAGDNTEAPVLEAVAQGVKLKEGAEVVTSGGDLLPPGLPVGLLVRDGAGYRVALFADAGTADDVRILDFRQEQMPAPTDRDLPAAAAGFKPVPPVEAPVSAGTPQAAAIDPPKPLSSGTDAPALAVPKPPRAQAETTLSIVRRPPSVTSTVTTVPTRTMPAAAPPPPPPDSDDADDEEQTNQ